MTKTTAPRPWNDLDDLVGGQDYRNYVFDGMALDHKDLADCTFEGCSFVRADLTGTRLNASVFRDCNLSHARVAGCNFFSASFEGCKFLGVDFHNGVTFTGAAFSRCNLNYAVFRGVSLAKMDWAACSFVEADLSLTDLSKTSFVDCDLTRVDIQEATFFQTDLRGANLTGWNLKDHNLQGIIITPAQFDALATELGILILEG
jgi:fluoroquinolone resistance protein